MDCTLEIEYHTPNLEGEWGEGFNEEVARQVCTFHQSFPGYQPTPLAALPTTAKELGIGGFYVKDESPRFGLNAFKGLGGSYCLGRYIASCLGQEISRLTFADLVSEETRKKVGEVTFVTATDGNHGRGIAWTARELGQKAVVYMPKGSSLARLEHIRALGAEAQITPYNYDDTVRFAQKQADSNGWVLVQDTAWPGYEEIPTHIMQGYLTMAHEALEQLGETLPTHIFLQAGVGAMSGALTAFFRNRLGGAPKIIIVEPDKADCIYRTAKAGDGGLHSVTGDLDTIMAGLACGEPCTIGWELLDHGANAFLSMADTLAARGMRILGNPPFGDDRVISGESGAAGFGAAVEILSSRPDICQKLELGKNSVILCFSTEGATDLNHYRKIVWDGKYPTDAL